MKRRLYDMIEGDETNLIIVVRKRGKIVDLTGVTAMKLRYTNAGAQITKNMSVSDPSSGQMAYRFVLDEIKAGDLEVSGEFIDAGGFRHTQTDAKHLSVGPRP